MDDSQKTPTLAHSQYLKSSRYIDHQHPELQALAKQLSTGLSLEQDECEIAKRCFEYVRDEIQHSWDYQVDIVTCAASDVLKHQTGYCYAKSHPVGGSITG